MDRHITTEEMTLLVEGRFPQLQEARLVAHLSRCERCGDLFQDATRDRARWEHHDVGFRATSELIALGEAAVGRRSRGAVMKSRGARPALNMRHWSVAAAAAVLVLSVSVWRHTADDGIAVPTSIVTPIRQAAERSSATAPMVIPGGESFGSAPPKYRSGAPVGGEELSQAIARLQQIHRDRKAGPEEIRWLIVALLANGRTSSALDYAREARRSFPDDLQIASVAAVVYASAGNVDDAERLLREVVARSPDDAAAAFNLGVALLWAGRRDAAIRQLERVASMQRNTAIARKSRELLAQYTTP